jgi:hypothetical protein
MGAGRDHGIREDVVSLRAQTHSDFNNADMRVYRRRLAAAAAAHDPARSQMGLGGDQDERRPYR